MSTPDLDRTARALAYFRSMGWTAEQAAGIVANLIAESNLDPAAVGDGGQAYGIAQWHSPRQAGFQALMGKPIQGSSFENQLVWVHAELQGTEHIAGESLRECRTAFAAGAVVSKLYERPADREGEADRRGKLAESLMTGAPAAEPAAPQPEKPVIPLLIPIIAQLLPGLISAFGNNSVRATQNAATAQVIADAVVKVTGAVAPGDAVDKLAAMDEAGRKAVEARVIADPAIQMALEAYEAGGGGIAGARRAVADSTQPFYKTAPFWMGLLFLFMVGAILADVLYVHPTIWRAEDRAQVLMLAVALTSAVSGYFLGSSIGSRAKDSIIAGGA